jgi:hypothetical protein
MRNRRFAPCRGCFQLRWRAKPSNRLDMAPDAVREKTELIRSAEVPDLASQAYKTESKLMLISWEALKCDKIRQITSLTQI